MKPNSNSAAISGWLILTVLTLGACSDDTLDKANPPNRNQTPTAEVDFSSQVLPLLERRCVHCHACYDAPCQTQLTSAEGIDRGAHTDKIYDATRLIADQTTRLHIDALGRQQWRDKGFFPILPATSDSNTGLQSLLAQVLEHKQRRELPVTEDGRLEDVFDLSLNRNWQCPTQEAYPEYAEEKPFGGMPFALPALADKELAILDNWLKNGAPLKQPAPAYGKYRQQVRRWENFLNQDSLKGRLVARYIYEHLYLANLYFPEISESAYFKLRRSSTPPGVAFNPVATRRPYDDPGVERVYYRLQLRRETIVAKTHMPYALDQQRLKRFGQLFIEKNYTVTELPGYQPDIASNPFISFAQIPINSRYRFMLEHAEFTIRGFMKGSVCRGQVALNVIDDHFWVIFVSPEHEILTRLDPLLSENADFLSLPAEAESEAEPVVNWLRYSHLQQQYLELKTAQISDYLADGKRLGLDYIWEGDGNNANALLTVFRHFDSASVRKGLYGPTPKTAWLIDYPVLERIHYLLVAGFDVYGNIGHQLLTRLYMDFLRMESQFNFLTLMPLDARYRLTNHWYRGASADTRDYLHGEHAYIGFEPGIRYSSQQPKRELFERLRGDMVNVLDHEHDLETLDLTAGQRTALRRIGELKGIGASLMPESSLLLVTGKKPGLVSLLRTSAHSNVSELFDESSRRIPAEDRIVVLAGVVGAYPDALWRVEASELDDFVDRITGLADEQGYRQLMQRYGIRRTNGQFWAHSDRIHQLYREIDPVNYGLLDYSRLENR